MTEGLDWIRTCHRRIMIGHHIPDFDQIPDYPEARKKYGLPDILENSDPKALVHALKEAHMQLFWFYSKCHFGNAYYPSKVGHVHSVLNGRDLFGEFCEACLSEEIIPACVYECSDHRMAKDHPDWCHKIPRATTMADGDTTDADQGARVGGACINGPYGDFMIEQAREVLKEYPIKAYYLDFLGLFGIEAWQCPYCGPKLKRDTGIDFRNTSELSHDDYVKYIRWRYAEADAYAKKLMGVMRELRPDVAITHNLHAISSGPNMQRFDLAAENCDFLSKDLFSLRAGTLQFSWILRSEAANSRHKPAEVLLDSVVCMAGDLQTLKALDSYNAELWTARSAGVAVCAGLCMNIDGSFDARTMELHRRLTEEHREFDPWFEEIEPLSAVGLARNHESTEFRRQPGTDSTDNPHHPIEFEGWAQTLIMSHHLWDVVWGHQLTDERLSKLKTLILPNLVCMSEAECAAVRRFVENGGTLIATCDTSLCDAQGHQLENFQLADVFGADFEAGREMARWQLSVDAPELQAEEPWVSRVLVLNNGQLAVRLHDGAEVLGSIFTKPALSLVNIFIPTELPGLVRNRFGRGTCYYFASAPGLNYRQFGQSRTRQLMQAVLDTTPGDAPPVGLEGAESIELFAHRQKGRGHLVVNLVNCVGSLSRTAGRVTVRKGQLLSDGMRFEEIARMPRLSEATLIFRTRDGALPKQVKLLPEEQPLPMETSGEECRVTLRDIGVHVAVVAEY